MTFDKDILFKPRLPEAEVPVPGIGSVRVRALSRDEAMAIRKGASEDDTALIERRMLALSLVAIDDQPLTLTEAEVGRWQQASTAGELEPVTEKISELSGMAEGAEKAAYKEFDADPAAEFRLPPSGEAGHDSGPTP